MDTVTLEEVEGKGKFAKVLNSKGKCMKCTGCLI